MAQVVEPESWHACLEASAVESLPDCITAHRPTIAPDEHSIRPGPLRHVLRQDRDDVRRNHHRPLACVRLDSASKAVGPLAAHSLARAFEWFTGCDMSGLHGPANQMLMIWARVGQISVPA